MEILDGSDELTARQMWHAIAEIMEMYRNETAGIPLPADVALEIEFAIKSMIAGYIVPSLKVFSKKRGARPVHPLEQSDIEWSSLYIEAVEAGLIDDPKPAKTVERAYGVTPRTRQQWRNRFPVNLENFHPDGSEPDRSNLIRNRMFAAGARYRALGRSQKSIIGRDKKRI